MSVQVSVHEKPREFEVRLGSRCLGKILAMGSDCRAEFVHPVDSVVTFLGWYATVRAAATAILIEVVGEGVVDSVTRRNAR